MGDRTAYGENEHPCDGEPEACSLGYGRTFRDAVDHPLLLIRWYAGALVSCGHLLPTILGTQCDDDDAISRRVPDRIG